MTNQRDAEGLTVQQRRILMDLAAGRTLREVLEREGVTSTTFNRWLRTAAFKQAFDDLFSSEDLENLKKTMNLAAISAVDVYTDAIHNAVKTVSTWNVCTKCGNKDQVFFEIEDWKSKLHAADAMLKITGIWIERRSDKIEVTHQIALTPYETTVLLAWKAGRAIPPSDEARLRELGHITGEMHQLPAANFREIKE